MAEKEEKIVLERKYNIPLRHEFKKVAEWKRAKKAMKAVKEFLARHMKAPIENIKVSKWVSQEIWKRGEKNPPHHIKVKAEKNINGIVRAELEILPKKAEEERKLIEQKAEQEKKKKGEEKKEVKEKEEEKTEEEKIKEEEEKEKEHIMKKQVTPQQVKHQHAEMKEKPSKMPLHRVALQK